MSVHDSLPPGSLALDVGHLSEAVAAVDAATGGLLTTPFGRAALEVAALVPIAAALGDRKEHAGAAAPERRDTHWFWEGISDPQPLPRHGNAMSPQRTRRASGQRWDGWRTTHPAA